MFITLLSFIAAFSLVFSCPRRENLYPCTCYPTDDSEFIQCEGIDNELDLLNSATALRGFKHTYTFTLKNVVLNYIPHDLFRDIKVVELEFLESSIMQFTDTDVAFEGLEDSLEKIFAKDCDFMNTLDWSVLRNMKELVRLDIIGGDLESVDESVSLLSTFSMEDINFSDNKISYLYDYAFSNFTELITLSLSNNLIETIKRSMLPNPATNLIQIDLGYNKILQLPTDFFENMPKLNSVSIASNNILTLNEKVFAPVWEQLEDFQALGNKLRCDCRMIWILEKRMPENVRAICELPRDLKGKNIATLDSKDLWC